MGERPDDEREAEFLAGGGKLIFPLPEVEIVSATEVVNLEAEFRKAS